MSDLKRVVYVTSYYPPFGAGGAERTCSLHARILVRGGVGVTVVTPNYGAEARETVHGVDIRRFPFERLEGIGRQVDSSRFISPSFHFTLAREVVRAALEDRPDCLHAQDYTSIIATSIAGRWTGTPVVGHIRDMGSLCGLGGTCLLEPERSAPPFRCSLIEHLRCSGQRLFPSLNRSGLRGLRGTASVTRRYVYFVLRAAALRRASRIAFSSNGVLAVYRHTANFQDRGRQRVVYNPAFPPEPEEHAAYLPFEVKSLKERGHPIVLYVGKVSRGKGADVLAAAHERLLHMVPDARLVIAGNLHVPRSCFEAERTVLLGFADPATVQALYHSCDVVVVSSTWPEPLGWSAIDAARHGKPVVATRVGGIPEVVIDGHTGILVERLSSNAMASAIAGLLLDPQRAVRMGAAAREHVLATLGEAAVHRQLLDLYSGLSASRQAERWRDEGSRVD